MKRQELDPKYLWQLSDIFATDQDWLDELQALDGVLGSLEGFRGRLNNAQTIRECLDASGAIDLRIERLYTYCYMRRDQDTANSTYGAFCERIGSLMGKWGDATSWLVPELSALPLEQLQALSADPLLVDYDYMLREIIRGAAHILSAPEERIMSLAENTLGTFRQIFNVLDNIELPFPAVNVPGHGKVKLTHGKFSELLHHQDRKVRRDAFAGMYQAVGAVKHTLTANYVGNVKKNVFRARVRNYESPLARALESDDVPTAVYTQLLQGVASGIPHMQKYLQYRRRKLGVRQLHIYDMYVALNSDVELKLDYEQAFDLVVEGLAPLGQRYTDLLKRARAQRWIDVFETENKRSGAYQWGPYGVHPFVLLNYKQTTHDIFTIAHELGHAMHSYHSYNALPYSKARYSIFVAEVASTVNEVLLCRHLLAKSTDPKLTEYLTQYMVDMARTTIFRQTMFSEFEYTAHNMELQGVPLTLDSLSDMYYQLNRKYYDTAGVCIDDDIRLEWARIPHFYNAFYVYKYATGLTTAYALADRILSGDTDSYYRFLSSGGHKSPYEILVDAGVDLASPEPYQTAMNSLAGMIDSLQTSSNSSEGA